MEGWFDDKRVVGYKTDWTDMSLPSCSKLRRPDSIGIGLGRVCRVESAKIIEITGEGRCLRAARCRRFLAALANLFDGKTLDGWNGDPGLWSVQDGPITGETTGKNTAAANTFLTWRAAGPPISRSRPSSVCPIRASPIRESKSAVGKVRAGQVSGYQADMDSDDQYRELVMAKISAELGATRPEDGDRQRPPAQSGRTVRR